MKKLSPYKEEKWLLYYIDLKPLFFICFTDIKKCFKLNPKFIVKL